MQPTLTGMNVALSGLQVTASFGGTPAAGSTLFAITLSSANTTGPGSLTGTGWALITGTVQMGNGRQTAVWVKQAGASEPSSVTHTASQGGIHRLTLFAFAQTAVANASFISDPATTGSNGRYGLDLGSKYSAAADAFAVAYLQGNGNLDGVSITNGFGKVHDSARSAIATKELTGPQDVAPDWAITGTPRGLTGGFFVVYAAAKPVVTLGATRQVQSGQTATVGVSVTAAGTGAGAAPYSYEVEYVSGPAATLSGTGSTRSFVVPTPSPDPSTIVFRGRAIGTGGLASDWVTVDYVVSTGNAPPEVTVTATRTDILTGEGFTVTATAFDPDGTVAGGSVLTEDGSYLLAETGDRILLEGAGGEWSVTGPGPVVSSSALSDTTYVVDSVAAAGDYTLRYTARDSEGATGFAEVTVTAATPVGRATPFVQVFTVPEGATTVEPFTITIVGAKAGEVHTIDAVGLAVGAWPGGPNQPDEPVPVAPGVPRTVAGAAGNGAVTATWDRPLAVGDGVTGYEVELESTGERFETTGLSLTVLNRPNDIPDRFRVRALGPGGASDPSEWVAFTPAAPAEAPTLLAPLAPQTVTAGEPVTFQANVLGADTYVWKVNGAVVPSNGSFLTITPTASGTVAFTASNVAGEVSSSTTFTVAAGVPGAPTSVVISKNDAADSATISWAPPANDGGSPVTAYRAGRTAGGTASTPWSTVLPATARSQTLTLLTDGATYGLWVQAINAHGDGPIVQLDITMGAAAPSTRTKRVLIDTDLGGDPDDIQSLVRAIHYSDVLKIEGIVSSRGVTVGGQTNMVKEWIRRTDVDALRARGFTDLMTEADLLAACKVGNLTKGAPSASRSTQGSAHIIDRAHTGSADDPLWITVWGAITTVAQALYDDPTIAPKIRVYMIGDHNTGSNETRGDLDAYNWFINRAHQLGIWVIENGILPVESHSTFRGVWRGGDQTGEWHRNEFITRNIEGHGTTGDGEFSQKLGDAFPRADGPAEAVGALKEGDSPSILYLLSPVFGGVGDVDDPTADSWGGRFRVLNPAYPYHWGDLNATPDVCQGTINRHRRAYLSHWKARWDRYDVAVPDSTVGVKADRADDFVDSIGVNAHIHYTDTVYYQQFPAVRDLIVGAGIRHVRDYAIAGMVDRYVDLANRGVDFTMVQTIREADGDWRPPGSTLTSSLDTAKAVYNAGGLAGLEGVNEPDISSSFGSSWWTYARQHLADIKAGRDARGMSDVPVIGPGITWADATDELGNITAWTNIANMHPYTGGVMPESSRPTADRNIALANNVPGGKVWFTECGYHNRVPSDTGHLGTPEDIAGVYLVRMFLHYWSLGIPRSYLYEFIDQYPDSKSTGAENRFGIVRNNLSPKAGYTALKALIELLADPGVAFTTERLNYTVSGGDSATRHHLFQKRNGSFWLALWQATSLWDPSARQTSDPADRNVTVNFGRSANTVRRYQPNTAGTSSLASHTSIPSLAVTSSERATLLEIA